MTRAKTREVATTPVKCTIDIRESSNIHNDFFKSLNGYENTEDLISLLPAILQPKYRNKLCTIDTGYNLLSWKSTSLVSGEGILRVKELGDKDISVYEKKIPLIDPFHWMKYNERPVTPFSWRTQNSSVLHPENQAYIDALGSSLVSKLSVLYNSPHFCKVYGCFRTVVNNFKYNLHEDLEDVRFTNWFWDALEANEFKVQVVEKRSCKFLTIDEIKENLKPDDEFLEDSDSDDSGESEESENSGESDSEESEESEDLDAEILLPENTTEKMKSTDLTEIEEFSFDNKSVDSEPLIIKKKPSKAKSDSTDASDASFSDEYDIHAELPGMPVVILYSEKCEGTMDELLSDPEYVPINSCEKELRWTSWLFQVIAALCQLQGGLRLTHNDLHTNNVLWKKTDQEFLYYKDSLDRCWKIPTYGRIFTIIDFGRAIFSINNFYCISSDYQDGNNAAGQYNFGPLEDHDEPKILPNKSFDLCRLSSSLLRGLFPTNPSPKPNGKVITKEGLWEVKETEYSLFNILWAWLKNDKGANILETQSGREKYPGFDLYIEIAHNVHGAIPALQLNNPAIKGFLTASIPKEVKPIIIPL
jgi:hypothetical protein